MLRHAERYVYVGVGYTMLMRPLVVIWCVETVVSIAYTYNVRPPRRLSSTPTSTRTSSMPNDIDTIAHLQDIRIRVLNRERVTPAEMRDLLSDLRRDRENTAKTARSATAKKKAATASLSLDQLFPS